jgi:hypothetical protein
MQQIDTFKAGEDYPDDITVLTCRVFEKKWAISYIKWGKILFFVSMLSYLDRKYLK